MLNGCCFRTVEWLHHTRDGWGRAKSPDWRAEVRFSEPRTATTLGCWVGGSLGRKRKLGQGQRKEHAFVAEEPLNTRTSPGRRKISAEETPCRCCGKSGWWSRVKYWNAQNVQVARKHRHGRQMRGLDPCISRSRVTWCLEQFASLEQNKLDQQRTSVRIGAILVCLSSYKCLPCPFLHSYHLQMTWLC